MAAERTAPVEVVDDAAADLSVVQARSVAVLGWEGAAAAHALCLRDSGVDVRVGLPDGSPHRTPAEAEGLRVVPPYDACEESDVVSLLVPAGVAAAAYAHAVAPNLLDGEALVVGSGMAVRHGLVRPPAGVDVVLVAPQGPPDRVRRAFGDGRGVPTLVAVEQDATGTAWDLTVSYAKALGGTRGGALRTTFAAESDTTMFATQAVLAGGVPELVRAAAEVLVTAGYPAELAYLECLYELRGVVDLAAREGLPALGAALTDVAAYGGATRGREVVPDAVRTALRAVLDGVRDGSFVDEWQQQPDEPPAVAEQRRRDGGHPLEQGGRRLRPLLRGL